MKVWDAMLILCGVCLLALPGCVTFEESLSLLALEDESPSKTLTGVWTLKGSDIPTYEIIPLLSGPSQPVETGIRRDFVFLVNPPIEGDKVYQEDGTFFFKDQLKREVFPVFELREGIRSYHIETNESSSEEFIIEDNYDWGSIFGGEFPYIMGIPLEKRLKDGRTDRIYLDAQEVPLPWISEGDWVHFFRREDLTLLNP